MERGTFSLSFTLDPDLAAVQFDQVFAEGEAQAGPLVSPVHRLVHPLKAAEDPILILGRYPDARYRHIA